MDPPPAPPPSKRRKKDAELKSIPVVTIESDGEEKENEDQGGKKMKVVNGKRRQGGGGGGTRETDEQEQHRFAVPMPVPMRSVSATVPRAKTREREEEVVRNDRTVMSRKMRHVISGVIRDVHLKLKENPGCPSLKEELEACLEHFVTCWEKVHWAFTSAPTVPPLCGDLEDVDFSSTSELKEFMFHWLHGLSSIVLVPEMRCCSNRLVSIIQTFVKTVSYGNPEFLEAGFEELLEIITKLIRGEVVCVELEFPVSSERISSSQGVSITISGRGEQVVTLRMPYEVRDVDNEGIEDLLEILKAFIPSVLYWNPRNKRRFVWLLYRLWKNLSKSLRLKLFSSFFVPTIPLIDLRLTVTEIVLVQLVKEMITEGTALQDSQSLHLVNRLCYSYSTLQWSIWLNVLASSSSYLPRFPTVLSGFINSKTFRSIEGAQRRKITQICHILLSQCKITEIVMRQVKPDINEDVLMLDQDTIFQEAKTAFDAISGLHAATNWRFHPKVPGVKDVEVLHLGAGCIPSWEKYVSDLDNLLNKNNTSEDFSCLEHVLRLSCRAIEVASNVNYRLVQYAKSTNRQRMITFIPSLEILSEEFMSKWSKFVSNSVAIVLRNGTTHGKQVVNDLFLLVLDAIMAFCGAEFNDLQVSRSLFDELGLTVGIMWIHEIRMRIPKLNVRLRPVLKGVSLKFSADVLDLQTKARCLECLRHWQFIGLRDVIVELIHDVMATSHEVSLVKIVLSLISEENWIIRSMPWVDLVLFVRKILTGLDWEQDPALRNRLASALAKLPCLYVNEKMREAPSNETHLTLRLLLRRPCEICKPSQKTTWDAQSEYPFTSKQIVEVENGGAPLFPVVHGKYALMILTLAQPILRSRFRRAKILLSSLIKSIKGHCGEVIPHVIEEFTSAAVASGVSVGQEIMRQLSNAFQRKPTPLLYHNLLDDDEVRAGIKAMFASLHRNYQKVLQEGKSYVKFSTKMLIILKELTGNPDRSLTLELLKFCLLLIIFQDSNARNTLAHTIVSSLAQNSNHVCLPSELMTRVRLDIAPTIVQLIRDNFCEFNLCPKATQLERLRAFLLSISDMGGYKRKAFAHQYVPVMIGEVVPNVASDRKYHSIFKFLAKFIDKPSAQLLQDAFPMYYRKLVLDCSVDRIQETVLFFQHSEVGGGSLDLKFFARNASAKALTELVFYLNKRKDKVLKFLSPLRQAALEEPTEFLPVTLTRSQIQDILGSHLMEFFIFLDTKLHSRLECITIKRRILESFVVLLELLGKTKVTQNRTKIYTTLNSLFNLGPEVYDLLFNAWKCFSMQLEDAVLGSMSTPILSAVCALHFYLPKQIDELILFFVSSKKELVRPHYRELYFVSDFTTDPKLMSPVLQCTQDIIAKDGWISWLELLVKEAKNENSHVRTRALTKLHSVLHNEYNNVKTLALGQEHPVVSELLWSFMHIARDADRATLMRLAECFGLLGAVDPYRFRNVQADEIRRTSQPVMTVDTVAFPIKFLEVLIREFQEAEETTDFDYCACLIQQVLSHFNVTNNESDQIWRALSYSSRELVEPLLTSKYKVEKGLGKANFHCPIYLSDDGKTFDQWLSNLYSLLAMSIPESEPVHRLFQFPRCIVSRNNRIASFLLPFVATYVVISSSEDKKHKLLAEIEAILYCWIDQDKYKSNSQMLLSVKETQAAEDMEILEPEPKVFLDEDVIQRRCTQEIFAVFDHLHSLLRHAKRQIGLHRANADNRIKGAQPQEATVTPCLTLQQVETLGQAVHTIHMDMVSQVAFHCNDFSRALFYAELDLKKCPDKFQTKLGYLQQIYICLKDMDSIVGVAALRKYKALSSHVVCEHLAKGKLEAGLRSLELMVNCDPTDMIATNGLLKAYLSLDEPRKAETLLEGAISRNPHWEAALEEFQIEAAWKLHNWDSLLQEDFKRPPTSGSDLKGASGSSEGALVWAPTIVKILSLVKCMDIDMAFDVLNDTRLKVMNPLMAAANDYNAYSQSYANIVQLHILSEVEQVLRLMQNTGKPDFVDYKEVKDLITRWKDREDALLKSQEFVDPILNVRKSLLEILKGLLQPPDHIIELINNSIRDCWLTAATVESKAGNFTRASNCILEASKFMSPMVMIENAKLLTRKGDKEHALQILDIGIPQHFPLVAEWKSGNVQDALEMRKLCAKALLLQAKLNDELQRLDNENNITNYEACTRVFKESEKNYFLLAGFHDRLYNSASDKSPYKNTQEEIVRFYAKSLHYGCRYIFQSLPRLLSIWLDYADLHDTPKRPSNFNQVLVKMMATIRSLMQEVPSFVLLTAFSQLLSRLMHKEASTAVLLKELIVSVISSYPHQGMWRTMVLARSSMPARKSKCKEIFKALLKQKPGLKTLVASYSTFGDKMDQICTKGVLNGASKTTIQQLCPALPRLLEGSEFGDILIPFNVFLSPSIPPNGCVQQSYDAFPQKLVFVRKVDNDILIFNSVQKPKKIVLIGSDGKRYGIMCKKEDDLRKDQKVVEVAQVVNWYLHRNPESRQRQLYVRLYAVIPLNEKNGIMEFVPNLTAFRIQVLSLYKDRGKANNVKHYRDLMAKRSGDTVETIRDRFLKHIVEPNPPVFSHWFLNNFSDPQSWYKARMAYTRTTAVMSMVGFVLGLGDRHGENINLDSSTGEVVHVDFNCIFNRGETFAVPERVPFRLTQNMVEAMGPLGVEGVFRRSCEITLKLFRQHKDVFLSVLRPFAFDPMVEWEDSGSCRSSSPDDSHASPKATEHLQHIQNRIEGTARNFTKDTNSALSIEAQVSYLIEEATSPTNLCQMFYGWTPWI